MSKGCLKYFMVSATHDREQLLIVAEQCIQSTFSIEGVTHKVSDVVDITIRQQSGKSAIISLKSKENKEEWNDLLYQVYSKSGGKDIENGVYVCQYITDMDIYLKGVNAWVEAIRQAIPDINIALQNDIVN